MNRKRIYVFAALLISTVLVIVLWRASDTQERETVASRNETTTSNQAVMSGGSPVPPGPSQAGSGSVDETHKDEVRQGLETIFEGLKKMGAKEVPPIAETLKEAVATGDPRTMLRAFHEAIYGRFAQMSEAIPAIRAYLDSPEPYVRFLAAEALVKTGDHSGLGTLAALAGSEKSIIHQGNDLRVQAAKLLGRYGDERAATALERLYSVTGDGSVLNALARVQGKNPSKQLVEQILARRSPGFVAVNLGLIDQPVEEGSLRETFNDPKVPEIYAQETKTAAAWALARMTGADQYVNYLSEAARPAIEKNETGSLSYDDSTKSLKYLGSIQSPQAVRVLETALESQNPVAVQYATVNLLFNQPGGSQKAEQLVIKELQTSPRVLGTELTMQIASKLDNLQIRAAAESFAARTGSDSWRYWGVERAGWPVQNWIYDYVITLNP